jgi:hypothetical protein
MLRLKLTKERMHQEARLPRVDMPPPELPLEHVPVDAFVRDVGIASGARVPRIPPRGVWGCVGMANHLLDEVLDTMHCRKLLFSSWPRYVVRFEVSPLTVMLVHLLHLVICHVWIVMVGIPRVMKTFLETMSADRVHEDSEAAGLPSNGADD